MGPFLPSLIGAVITAILERRRRCPQCGRKQVVTFGRRLERVRCVRCGASIPPPR
jgi:transcription elongation factor Elf1